MMAFSTWADGQVAYAGRHRLKPARGGLAPPLILFVPEEFYLLPDA